MGILAHNIASEKFTRAKESFPGFTSTTDSKLVDAMQTNP